MTGNTDTLPFAEARTKPSRASSTTSAKVDHAPPEPAPSSGARMRLEGGVAGAGELRTLRINRPQQVPLATARSMTSCPCRQRIAGEGTSEVGRDKRTSPAPAESEIRSSSSRICSLSYPPRPRGCHWKGEAGQDLSFPRPPSSERRAGEAISCYLPMFFYEPLLLLITKSPERAREVEPGRELRAPPTSASSAPTQVLLLPRLPAH